MSTAIRPVVSRRDYKQFIDLPYRLYQDNPYWVPPLRMDQKHVLDPDKNAFFNHGRMQLFLAENDDGETVGRIAGIINGMHLDTYDDGAGFFGFFETIDDYSVAEALLTHAADWLREQGLRQMRGPTNPTMNDTTGLLIEGFDRRPALLMPYNPPYYKNFLQQYGLKQVMTMWAYYVHQKYVKTERLRRGVRLLRKRNPSLSIRPVEMSRFHKEAKLIRDIYNDAWADNWGHVPVTDAEFAQLAENLKQIVDPALALILELDDEPIAFSVTFPDINKVLRYIPNGRLFPFGLAKLLLYTQLFSITSTRMALMGVRREHQGKGFGSIPILETIDQGLAKGYDDCELSWVLDSNHPMKNAIEALGGVKDKQYGMFATEL